MEGVSTSKRRGSYSQEGEVFVLKRRGSLLSKEEGFILKRSGFRIKKKSFPFRKGISFHFERGRYSIFEEKMSPSMKRGFHLK